MKKMNTVLQTTPAIWIFLINAPITIYDFIHKDSLTNASGVGFYIKKLFDTVY